jgi:hypothetical protein
MFLNEKFRDEENYDEARKRWEKKFEQPGKNGSLAALLSFL